MAEMKETHLRELAGHKGADRETKIEIETFELETEKVF